MPRLVMTELSTEEMIASLIDQITASLVRAKPHLDGRDLRTLYHIRGGVEAFERGEYRT
jgi:hypothetical protein